MGGIYVELTPSDRRRLIELATRELREPRKQAAKLIRDGLAAAGPTEQPEGHPSRTVTR